MLPFVQQFNALYCCHSVVYCLSVGTLTQSTVCLTAPRILAELSHRDRLPDPKRFSVGCITTDTDLDDFS